MNVRNHHVRHRKDIWKNIIGDAEHVYAVTLSAELSGSYNSAVFRERICMKKSMERKDIYVFNSRSASVGETLIGLKIAECEKKGHEFSGK